METWRTAHLKQARSDLAVFDAISNQPICQQLHYIQMATEKVAKAYLSAGDERPPQIHDVIVRFLRACRGNSFLQNACRMRREQFRAYVKSLLTTGEQIEDLVPAKNVDKPNPEYPWQENDKVIAPVDYPFVRLQLTQTKMARLIEFVRICVAIS